MSWRSERSPKEKTRVKAVTQALEEGQVFADDGDDDDDGDGDDDDGDDGGDDDDDGG